MRNPPTIMIGIIGPRASGKSTASVLVEKALRKAGFETTIVSMRTSSGRMATRINNFCLKYKPDEIIIAKNNRAPGVQDT